MVHMFPGPDQIIACPHCKELARYSTWLSGTSFGVIVWTDGKQEHVGMMGSQPPAVVRCRHCGECYWLADAEKIGTIGPLAEKGQQVNPAWSTTQEVEEPAEDQYYL